MECFGRGPSERAGEGEKRDSGREGGRDRKGEGGTGRAGQRERLRETRTRKRGEGEREREPASQPATDRDADGCIGGADRRAAEEAEAEGLLSIPPVRSRPLALVRCCARSRRLLCRTSTSSPQSLTLLMLLQGHLRAFAGSGRSGARGLDGPAREGEDGRPWARRSGGGEGGVGGALVSRCCSR